MKKYNVVITAGGTTEDIDEVRKITNTSTGKLGSLICEEILTQKNNEIEKIFYICSRKAVHPKGSEKINIIEIDSVEDLKNAVTDTLLNNKIDYFIHSMAVSDYTTNYVSNYGLIAEELASKIENNKEKLTLKELIETSLANLESVIDKSKKISSSADNLVITLKPTEKVISLIKKLSPKTFLVGFKLLNNVPREELFNVGFNLLRKNKCNLVLANDLKDIKEGNHIGLLIYPEKIYDIIESKESIASTLVTTMFNRDNDELSMPEKTI